MEDHSDSSEDDDDQTGPEGMEDHSASSEDDDDQTEPEGMEDHSDSSEDDDDQIEPEGMEDHTESSEDDDQIEREGMEDHSESSEDDDQIEPEGMEDDSELSEDDSELSEEEEKIEPADEVIISYYLNMMINNNHKACPFRFLRDEMMYHLNPWLESPKFNYFVFVKRRTEACGKTDGCGSGCWRIMARDKVIKTEETGRILGFKKILKFCEKEMERQEEQGTWVMEEYRLVDKWKQDRVICRIRLLLLPAVNSLLAKHFSFLSK